MPPWLRAIVITCAGDCRLRVEYPAGILRCSVAVICSLTIFRITLWNPDLLFTVVGLLE